MLFHELKAEVAGTGASIHVENAEAVEYGQLLFEIERGRVHGDTLLIPADRGSHAERAGRGTGPPHIVHPFAARRDEVTHQ